MNSKHPLNTRQKPPGRITPLRSLREIARKALSGLCKRSQPRGFGDETPILANHGQVREGAVALTNDFTVLQDNWVQISPLGDFINVGPRDRNGKPKYPQGVIQRVDKEAVEAMVNAFESARTSKGSHFGGLPWYVGHPDMDPEHNPDKGSYGWIMALRNGGDQGLMGQVKWTEEGQQLKESGKYKYFSPCWYFDDENKLDNGKPVMRPDELVSVGFTNTPQIPVRPLSNEAEALANAGTSAGAKKGWETRRANASKPERIAARAAAKSGPKKPRSKSTKASAAKASPENHDHESPSYQEDNLPNRGQQSLAKAEPKAVHAAAAAAAPSKPKGFFASLFHSLKNPGAHSGDAFGNSRQ